MPRIMQDAKDGQTFNDRVLKNYGVWTRYNMHNATKVKPWLQLRFDCDTTTIRLRRIARACFHSMRFDASKK